MVLRNPSDIGPPRTRERTTDPREQKLEYGLIVVRRYCGSDLEWDSHVQAVQEDVAERSFLGPSRGRELVASDLSVRSDQVRWRSATVLDGKAVIRSIEAASRLQKRGYVPPRRRTGSENEMRQDVANPPGVAERANLPLLVVELLERRDQRSPCVERDLPHVHGR
ncbi:MAG TPA: hypothetical protein VMW08_17080 [Acidimicrobiales bacterium]|nr:hypothetical protein [Acidimicrobiales bacterium]